MNYKKGDYIRYASNGICLIEDIKDMDLYRTKKPKKFYVLKPVNAALSTIYVPLENSELVSKMHNILSKKEIDQLIDSIEQDKIEWISDRKERNNSFKQVVIDSDPKELLKLVGCIYLEKQKLSKMGKKLSSTDQNYLSQAELFIENEFSFVLGMDGVDIGNYIKKRLGIC